MPPRLLRVVPRGRAGQHRRALDRRAADHAAHLHFFDALHLVGPRERDGQRAFHVAAAHRAAERPFSGEALEAGDLVFAAKRLARARTTMPATRSCAASGEYEMPSN